MIYRVVFVVATINAAAAMHVVTTRRGYCLRSWSATAASAAALHLLTTVPPVATAATDDILFMTVEQQCAAGSFLAVEQAVPGAYQQACMTLPVRTIPIIQQQQQGATSVVKRLEIQQLAGSSLAGSTGTVVWNSSLLLTRLLERLAATDPTVSSSSSSFADQTVLELGCGTALVSLAAAFCLGAGSVIATDGNSAVVELAAANIERNHASAKVRASTLQWGLLSAMDFSETADLVLGSDLTYFSGNWPALAETMATVLKPTGTVLYLSLGHSGFNVNSELDGFLSVASGYGLVPQPPVGVAWTERYLTNRLLQECLTVEERAMVNSTGGVRVVALCHSSKFRSR